MRHISLVIAGVLATGCAWACTRVWGLTHRMVMARMAQLERENRTLRDALGVLGYEIAINDTVEGIHVHVISRKPDQIQPPMH